MYGAVKEVIYQIYAQFYVLLIGDFTWTRVFFFGGGRWLHFSVAILWIFTS